MFFVLVMRLNSYFHNRACAEVKNKNEYKPIEHMFWASYSNEVKAVIRFIELHKVKVNHETVNNEMQNHPDYPSLLCINDCLRKWNIPNAAGKINSSQIDELPLPFLALNQNTADSFLIVTEVSTQTVQYYVGNYKIPVSKSRSEFINDWDGLFLIAEPNSESGEKGFHLTRRRILFNRMLRFLLLLISISYTFYLFNISISNDSRVNDLGLYIQYACFLMGSIVCSLLLWYEIDHKNTLLQKVCTGIARGNCAAILTSKSAKIFSWLSWSEVGFFYFLGGFLATIIFPTNLFTPILTLLALPYIVFSIYFQWKIAKQWCVLCLLVQAILLLSATNVIANRLLAFPSTLTFAVTIKSVCLYFLPVMIWFILKPYLLKLYEAKNTRRGLSRLKFNTDVFRTLLEKQKRITISTEGLGIDLGNPKGQNILIKVCNPSCVPCSQSHPKIENLLRDCPDLKVKIIFNAPNVDSLKNFKVVTHFLAAAEESDQSQMRQILNSWYLSSTKDYSALSSKQPPNLSELRSKVTAMYNWVKEEKIRATPTFFFNDHQLPDAYGVEDLKYFLLE